MNVTWRHSSRVTRDATRGKLTNQGREAEREIPERYLLNIPERKVWIEDIKEVEETGIWMAVCRMSKEGWRLTGGIQKLTLKVEDKECRTGEHTCTKSRSVEGRDQVKTLLDKIALGKGGSMEGERNH